MYKIIWLCGGKNCCPSVALEGDEVVITDDFGGKVRLPAKALPDLTRAAGELEALRTRQE